MSEHASLRPNLVEAFQLLCLPCLSEGPPAHAPHPLRQFFTSGHHDCRHECRGTLPGRTMLHLNACRVLKAIKQRLLLLFSLSWYPARDCGLQCDQRWCKTWFFIRHGPRDPVRHHLRHFPGYSFGETRLFRARCPFRIVTGSEMDHSDDILRFDGNKRVWKLPAPSGSIYTAWDVSAFEILFHRMFFGGTFIVLPLC